MKLTRKKAIKLSIELWEWMAEKEERYKDDWPKWKEFGGMENNCPLCEYVGHEGTKMNCPKCPLGWGMYGCEEADHSMYREWKESIWQIKPTRKKYAGLFLAQLKELE